MEKVKVFVSGRLDQSKPENQKTYEIITGICESLGFEVWLPHRDTRKEMKEKFSKAEEIVKNLYDFDLEKVKNSDLVIAELTNPSFGVGLELRVCHEYNIDVIALAREEANVSVTVIGDPAIKKFFRYRNLEELETKLKKIMEKYSKDKNYLKANHNFPEMFKEWANKSQVKMYSWIFE
ncbi:MAG: nucleoside 2-deoxyribosyltransferase [Candidatus Aenigmatarchaeota archaeon]